MANAQHDNDTYRLYSSRPSAVAVLNQDGFLMAEYDQTTGATAWLRVVAATKREAVEQRLAQQFPAVVETTVAAPRPRAKKRRS